MGNNKKILICGLGAIGGYYASRFYNNRYNLKILADKDRIERYRKTPRIINGVSCSFDYILPDNNDFKADLIIIATKSNGLNDAIENINNFITDETIILSFLNGITSERKLIERYGNKVLYSYLLGHTFFRNGNKITHDGHEKIIFGSTIQNDHRIEIVKNILEDIDVEYDISADILRSLWQKFCFNCCVNQLSAITRMTFGEIRQSKNALNLIKNICIEIEEIAKNEGITKPDFYNNVIKSLDLMIPNGKTSMLQDIEAGRTPETDLFGDTIVNLGEKHNIETPYNKIISEIIKSLTFSI